jgi:hypothetical protein
MQREIRVIVSCSVEVLRQRAICVGVNESFVEATSYVEKEWIRTKSTSSLSRIKIELASIWMTRYQNRIEQYVGSLLMAGGLCHCPFSLSVKEYINVDKSMVFTIFVDIPNVRPAQSQFEICRILCNE